MQTADKTTVRLHKPCKRELRGKHRENAGDQINGLRHFISILKTTRSIHCGTIS